MTSACLEQSVPENGALLVPRHKRVGRALIIIGTSGDDNQVHDNFNNGDGNVVNNNNNNGDGQQVNNNNNNNGDGQQVNNNFNNHQQITNNDNVNSALPQNSQGTIGGDGGTTTVHLSIAAVQRSSSTILPSSTLSSSTAQLETIETSETSQREAFPTSSLPSSTSVLAGLPFTVTEYATINEAPIKSSTLPHNEASARGSNNKIIEGALGGVLGLVLLILLGAGGYIWGRKRQKRQPLERDKEAAAAESDERITPFTVRFHSLGDPESKFSAQLRSKDEVTRTRSQGVNFVNTPHMESNLAVEDIQRLSFNSDRTPPSYHEDRTVVM
ncbi:hypothetical protein HGRIS_009038 [Hohenbuehelia grisea]|uniref:Uncharacterized protein n=1 Tax=Hohenbuehelia grisea TaxID=104357 RepID=A0ABR3J0C9_9AGAR